jgi:hypothetical protein
MKGARGPRFFDKAGARKIQPIANRLCTQKIKSFS